MKKRPIADVERVVLALRDEIRRSPESCYDHRLHGRVFVSEATAWKSQRSEVGGKKNREIVRRQKAVAVAVVA